MSSQRQNDPLGEWFGELSEDLGTGRWRPAADVYETEDAVVVRLELSGVARSEIQVSLDRDRLRVRGVRQPRMEQDARRLHRMEIAFGPFERSLRIQVPFDRERVTAQLEDGFLRVTFPKRRRRDRRIQVTGDPEAGS